MLAVAGCGSGGDETALLGPGEAATLDRQVELVGERAGRGDCAGAERALARYAELVAALPQRRDAELRRALRDGATELEGRITAECEQPAEEEPEATTTAPETTAPTTTAPATTETEPPPVTTTTEPPPVTTTGTTTPPPVDPGVGGDDGAETPAPDADPGDSGGAMAPEDG